MASVRRQLVFTTHGKDYMAGDSIIMRLKNGKILVGIIKGFSYTMSEEYTGYSIRLYLEGQSDFEIPVDKVDD